MKVTDYPRFTIIMRGYTYEQAEAILTAMKGFENDFAVELTLNTTDALKQLQQLCAKFGKTITIGAGTVRNISDAEGAIAAGAQFLLGPHTFTTEILSLAKTKKVLAVPAAMTPSEINEMFEKGADIVKIFPAAVVTPRFFADVQAPLGQLPLMAVGGISANNAKEFFDQGASYLGIGSNLFQYQDLQTGDIQRLAKSLQTLLAAV
ncbi:bifunctional 4-hydroxy-2-oxoglutarate aldolase/2-dehydro-3-deoxy-phosphogluconate aldolase [Enterococcus sp.]|uniref:bifunctional 4-hydroxy-2-oxoglutarate aldolase/2-dehydro-3-deoxy-phosphogluconate aldolase n=1 Tax=Enterococcus sp. TaxID=35783 RepID=UPI0025BBEA0D|nr:bifunctional 4-hydroxy-2-oxoglutarate aldolase/2-dehydro-3-deoxy-phosphogluconate aldolase [Enterococcus sp.]